MHQKKMSAGISRHITVRSMPRDLEIFFLYQQSGRFPDLQIITQNRLPKAFATVYPTVLLPQ